MNQSSHPPVDISWEAGAPPPELCEPALREALVRFLRALGHPGAGLSLLFAGDDRLRDLNFKYRGK